MEEEKPFKTFEERREEIGRKLNLGCGALAALAALLFVGYCSYQTSLPHAKYDDLTYKTSAQELIRQRLRDPGSAEFGPSTVTHDATLTKTTICGTVNAKNAFGGMTGTQRYMVGDTVTLEEDVGADAMTKLWAKSC